MKALIFSTLLVLPLSYGKQQGNPHSKNKVVVLDTGFFITQKEPTHTLCSVGHKDFTDTKQPSEDVKGLKDPVPLDLHGHGTNLVGIIDRFAGTSDYCIVVVKYITPVKGILHYTKEAYIKALEYSIKLDPKIINMSGGGYDFYPEEKSLIEEYLTLGGIFIAAAGNSNKNIDLFPYYPAMLDHRIITVGNTLGNGKKAPTSNFGGRVTLWELGQDIEGYGIKMSGTSQATATHTGKTIKKLFGCKK